MIVKAVLIAMRFGNNPICEAVQSSGSDAISAYFQLGHVNVLPFA